MDMIAKVLVSILVIFAWPFEALRLLGAMLRAVWTEVAWRRS